MADHNWNKTLHHGLLSFSRLEKIIIIISQAQQAHVERSRTGTAWTVQHRVTLYGVTMILDCNISIKLYVSFL